MTTKITLIVDNPTNPAVFEELFSDLPRLGQDLPKLRRLESAKVWPKEDGSPTPAHRTLDLYFDNYEDASAAIAAPEAHAFLHRLSTIGTPFTGLFSNVEQQ